MYLGTRMLSLVSYMSINRKLGATLPCSDIGIDPNSRYDCIPEQVYTQQTSMQQSLQMTATDTSNTLAVGYAAYAIGKIAYGPIVDAMGGKWSFVLRWVSVTMYLNACVYRFEHIQYSS